MPTPEEIRTAARQALSQKGIADEDRIGISEQIYKEQEEMFSRPDMFEEEDVAKEVVVEEEIVEQKPLAKPGEVVWQGHPSWRGMAGHISKGLLVWLGISAIFFVLSKTGVVAPVLSVVVILVVFAGVIIATKLIIKTTVYTVTRVKVSERRGIINTVSEQAHISQITNIQITRNFYERMVGIGKVDIDTASDVANLALAQKGSSKAKNILDWWGVKDPYKIQAIIDDLREEQL